MPLLEPLIVLRVNYMKYFALVVITFSIFFAIPHNVSAQTDAQCNPVTAGTYRLCCGGPNAADYAAQCSDFEIAQQTNQQQQQQTGNNCATVTASNEYDCCVVNAGRYAQQCDLYYGTQAGGVSLPGTTINGYDTGTIAGTPNTSAPGITQCSQIRFNSLLDILIWAKCIIGAAIIPLLFSIAFLVFLWGMVGYIRDGADVKKREESKKFIYWGILGLTVMVGVWGIVNIVTTTFGLGDTVPQLQTDCLTTDPKNPCRK